MTFSRSFPSFKILLRCLCVETRFKCTKSNRPALFPWFPFPSASSFCRCPSGPHPQLTQILQLPPRRPTPAYYQPPDLIGEPFLRQGKIQLLCLLLVKIAAGRFSRSARGTESAYCSRYCTYLMLDASCLGSTIVALLFFTLYFPCCYSFLLGYLSLSSLIAFVATFVPFRQPYAFLLVLLD